MRSFLYFVSFFVLFGLGCKNSETSIQGASAEYRYTFGVEAPVSFPLDSLTGFFGNDMQFVPSEDDLGHLMLFNTAKGILYKYNYENRTLSGKMQFYREGENGLGSFTNAGILYHNRDSIFIFSPRRSTLFICNEEGQVKDKFVMKLEETEATHAPFPKISVNSPAFKFNNKIYMHGMSIDPQEDHTKLESFLALDLSDKSISTMAPRPELYNEGNWGLGFKYNLYACYNPKEKALVFGFAMDHAITVKYLNGVTRQFSAKSDYFNEQEPYSSKIPTNLDRDQRIDRYSFTTPNYYSLVYDPYQDLYYRFFMHPLEDDEYTSVQGGLPLRIPGVIILDNQFNKVGEFTLSNRDFVSYFFVNEAGLHIASKDLYLEDESKLMFNLYKIREL
jgi:hypothetical protein